MDRQSLAEASILFRNEDLWDEDTQSQAQELHDAILRPSHLSDTPEMIGESRAIGRWARAMLADSNPTAQAWRQFYLRNFILPLRRSTNGAGRLSQGLRPSQRILDHCDCLICLKKLSTQLEDLGWPTMSRVPVAEPAAALCFPADELPAFRGNNTDPGDLESWIHVLQAHITETFTATTRDHLDQLGFMWNQESSQEPTSQAESEVQTDPESLCFPWFIADVEASATKLVSKADCRAASVCVPAIVALGRLAEISVGDIAEGSEADSAPLDDFPVVAMTASGKDVCVWIVYWDEIYRVYNSSCAWTGDITTTADVVKLRTIFDNLAAWATTKLQPKISSYVTRWRHRFLSACVEADDEGDDELDLVTKRFGNLRVARTNSWRVGPLGLRPIDTSATVNHQTVAKSPLQPLPRSENPSEEYSTSGVSSVVLQHSSITTLNTPRTVSGPMASTRLSPDTGGHAKPGRERPQSFDGRLYNGVKINLDVTLPRAQDDSGIGMPGPRIVNANHWNGVEFNFNVSVSTGVA